jgi:hypothetical protein
MAKNTFSYDEAFQPEASLVPTAKTFSYEDALLPVAKEKTPVVEVGKPTIFSFEEATTPATPTPTPTATKPKTNIFGEIEPENIMGIPTVKGPIAPLSSKDIAAGAFGQGLYNVGANAALLKGKITGDTEEAEKRAAELRAAGERTYIPTDKSFTEAPIDNVTELLFGSLPYMVAPAAAAIAAPALGSAPITVPLAAGATSALQFAGSNLARQMENNKKLEDTSLLKAGLTAIPQAALDIYGFRLIPGIRNIFGKAGIDITEDAAAEVAKKTLLSRAGEFALDSGKLMSKEGLTETGQQLLERLQAGLSITDEQARNEYYDSFTGGALLAGTLAIPGTAFERMARKKPTVEEEVPLPNAAGLSDEQLQQSRADYIKGVKEKVRSRAATLNELEVPAVAEEAVAQPAPIVAEEATAPITTLNPDTLRSLGLRSNTNAYKALNGVDIATPEGRTLFEQTLAANTGKVNEEAANTLLTSLPPIEMEAPIEPIEPVTIEPTADRASVSTLDEQRIEVPAEGAVETDRGTLGPAGVDVGQPAGGAVTEPAALANLQVGDTLNVGEQTYRKTDTGFELVQPEPVQAIEPTEVIPAVEEAVAPESTEVLPTAEELQGEDPTVQARRLSNELRSLDPTDPLIEDLLAYDVDEDTIAQARNTVAQIVQERQAKGQTQPGELRELSEDLAATEGEPETEAMYRSEQAVEEDYSAEMEANFEQIAEAEKEITKTQAELANISRTLDYLDNQIANGIVEEDPIIFGTPTEQREKLLAKQDELTYKARDLKSTIESLKLDQDIIGAEYKRDSKRANLFEAEHYEGIIEDLINDNAIATPEADFFRALLNGDAKAALKAIAELPLTQIQEKRIAENAPKGPAVYGNRQLFKWYKTVARELLKSKVIPNKVIFSKNLTERVAGDYNAETDTVRIDAGNYLQTLGMGKGYEDVVAIFLHEVMHSATVNAMSKGMANIRVLNRMEARAKELEQDGTPNLARALRSEKEYKKAEAYLNTTEGIAAKNLFNIYDYLANFHSEVFTSTKHYGATNPLEMISEAFTDVRFQDLLMSLEIPKIILDDNPEFKGRGFKNMLDAFVDAIRRLLLMPASVSNTALAAVLENTSAVVRQNRTVRTSTTEEKYGRSKIYEKYQSYGNTIASKAKKQAVAQLQKQSGIKKPSNNAGKNLFKSVMDVDLNHAVDNLSSAVLSSDNGLNNQMRAALEKAGMSWNQIKQILEGLMTSQATHSQNVASMFLEMGKITYDTVANMFHVSENPSGSWGGMMQTLGDIAENYGMKMDEMELAAHTYFVANRARGLIERNKRFEKKALALEKAGKRKEADKLLDKLVLVHMTPDQIRAGMNIRREIPELGSVFEQWHAMRQEVISHLVTTGLYSQEQAAELWETFDYVPFYREAQIEANQGPKENTRGLLDRAREKHIKGSYNPVNNVFDNMNRWITYSIARGINNSQAQYAVNAMQQHMVGSISPQPLPPTAKVTPGNLVAVWENGEEKRYRVEDPMLVHYFTGARAAYAPWINSFGVTGVNKVFRAEIILDPLFSAGQVMMDGLTAMHTSGVKHWYMLPIRAIKEFLLTLPNWSKTHKTLRGYGTVGETDFASVSKRLAEENKYEARDLNVAEKIATTLLKPLRWITTASDNAIRQAVYEQEMAESGDKATAVRKAFEIINFRRAGYSSRINTLRQSVNFTGAYLQYINVTSKVLSGKGITPTQKKQTYVRLLNSLAGYGVLSFIMFMSVSDDDEYQETDQTTRDLRIFIPGLTEKTGVWLPVRADPFMLVSKMIPEHIYNLSREEGGEDWTKFKKAIKAYMDSAMLGPTPIPQLPKVALETMMNKNITTGRPIVGAGVEGRSAEREYTSTTSEFSKMLGSTGLVSPVMADYWINNLGASVGRAFIFLTNSLMKDSEAPEKTTRDKLASFAPKFIKREFGTRAKNDLYELRDIVDEAYLTFKDVQKFGSEAEYNKTYEETIDKVMQKPGIDVAIKQLAQIRAEERMILERPPGDMTKAEKEMYLKELLEREQIILFDIQFKRNLSGLDKDNPFRKSE